MLNQNTFPELISPYLKELMNRIEDTFGKESNEYEALFYQYICTSEEQHTTEEHNSKHYEAGYNANTSLRFMERLYKRQATVDITLACVAHCRYCLRQNYELDIMQESDMDYLAKVMANDPYLQEILLTGGDPLLASKQLMALTERIIHYAPNIRVIRIGSRLPVQSPDKVTTNLLDFFEKHRKNVKFELGMQINHTIELQPEATSCIKAIQEVGVKTYAQNVLLKGVNDNMDSLISLYDKLRYLDIESHYLFHPVPIIGSHKYRMTLARFLEFAKQLTSSGKIPGRSKPMFSLMTDIGKCTLYQGTVGSKNEKGYYDISTGYKLSTRQKWHKGYELPKTAYEDSNGLIHVQYLDGED